MTCAICGEPAYEAKGRSLGRAKGFADVSRRHPVHTDAELPDEGRPVDAAARALSALFFLGMARQVASVTQKQRQSQTKIADALFSKLVRSVGYCEVYGAWGMECNGNLQCSHVFSRTYRIVRFERMNAFSSCAAHHTYSTHHPLQWEDWCRTVLGDAVYDELRRTALAGGRVDYKILIPDLRRRLEAVSA